MSTPFPENAILTQAVDLAFGLYAVPNTYKWMPNSYKEELIKIYHSIKEKTKENQWTDIPILFTECLKQCPTAVNPCDYQTLILRNHSFQRVFVTSMVSLSDIYTRCVLRVRFLVSLQMWGFTIPITCLLLRSVVIQTIQEDPAFVKRVLENRGPYPCLVRELYYHNMVFPDIFSLSIFIVLLQDYVNTVQDLIPQGWIDRINFATLSFPKKQQEKVEPKVEPPEVKVETKPTVKWADMQSPVRPSSWAQRVGTHQN